MFNAATYSATDRLRDGRTLEVRALKPSDETEMMAAVGRIGAQSLYRRFMGAKRGFSDKERAFFLNVDFVNHVALAAVLHVDERAVIVGGGRYIVIAPGVAEVAFGIDDAHQGRGLGALLMKHLIAIARDGGLRQLVAEVLPGNAAMLSVFKKAGLQMTTKHESGVVHVTLHLP